MNEGDEEFIAEELFLSERDDEPFIIRYGLRGGELANSLRIPIAYESVGQDGRRLVVLLNGDVECLDEAECLERGVFQ